MPCWSTGPSLSCSREVPADALSRGSSWDLLGSLSFAPLGLLVAGPVAAATGTSKALCGRAALVVLATEARCWHRRCATCGHQTGRR